MRTQIGFLAVVSLSATACGSFGVGNASSNVADSTPAIASKKPAVLASQEPVLRYSSTYRQCIKLVDESDYRYAYEADVAKIDCIRPEMARQDARLNQAYKMVMARLSPAQKSKLQILERSWIKAREVRCSATGDGGGTLSEFLYADCMLEATLERTRFLEGYQP